MGHVCADYSTRTTGEGLVSCLNWVRSGRGLCHRKPFKCKQVGLALLMVLQLVVKFMNW